VARFFRVNTFHFKFSDSKKQLQLFLKLALLGRFCKRSMACKRIFNICRTANPKHHLFGRLLSTTTPGGAGRPNPVTHLNLLAPNKGASSAASSGIDKRKVNEKFLELQKVFSSRSSSPEQLEYANWLYEQLRNTTDNGTRSQDLYMSICASNEMFKEAHKVITDCEKAGLPIAPALLSKYLSLLASGSSETSYEKLRHYYTKYRNKPNLTFTASTYTHIALPFCKDQDPFAVEILKDMMEASHEPSPDLCKDLLISSLDVGNIEILQIIGNWYLTNFHETRLDQGVLRRFLQVASSFQNVELALLTIQVSHLYFFFLSNPSSSFFIGS
jgi:hypothetical protein